MFDIFISYRRDTGRHLAALLYEKLNHLGYSAYLDVDAIPAGAPFPDHIREGIAAAKDIIVVLTGNCLDSRNLPDGQTDWFWEEIRHATGVGAHIVPMADDLYIPPSGTLPDDIKQFALQNATPYKSDLRPESIRRLVANLHSVPSSPVIPRERSHKPNNLLYASLGSLFKGREETLAKITGLFDNHKSGAVALHGLGGIGKTRTAVEYAHANRDEFTAILYVSADSPQSIDTNIAGLCSSKALDLPQQTEAEAKLQYDAVKQWLRTNTDWLLIFDNADTEEAAQAVQRVTAELGPSGNILITSRLSNWPVHIKPLRIDQLSVNDAVDYLLSATASQRRETEGDEADATTLANVLGNLPLALSHAAAYIRRHTITFAQYLSRLEERREAVLSWNDPRLTDYPNSVLATWDTSFQQLSGEAKKLQQILSWFAPDPIPASIIENDVPDVVGSPGIASAMLEEALVELAGYSLITQDTISPQFSVHRLVQEVTRLSMSADVRDATLGQALKWLDTLFVGDLQDPNLAEPEPKR